MLMALVKVVVSLARMVLLQTQAGAVRVAAHFASVLAEMALVDEVLWQSAMLLEEVKVDADVLRVLADHFQEDVHQVLELGIDWVVTPSKNLNSILRLAAEVFFNVVNDNALLHRTARFSKILDVALDHASRTVLDLNSVLAIQTVSDRSSGIERVEDLISVILLSSGEDDKLEVLGHLDQELFGEGSDVEHKLESEVLKLLFRWLAAVFCLKLGL